MADRFSLTGHDESNEKRNVKSMSYLGKDAIDESNIEIDVSAFMESGWLMYSLSTDDAGITHAAFVQAGAESIFKGRVPVVIVHVGTADGSESARAIIDGLAERNSGETLTAIGGEELIELLEIAMGADALGISDKSLANSQFAGFDIFMEG